MQTISVLSLLSKIESLLMHLKEKECKCSCDCEENLKQALEMCKDMQEKANGSARTTVEVEEIDINACVHNSHC